jgi:glycosyltransferase involved in cell wall biosynthesis
MRILWFKWKDVRHPDAGGAEIVSHELMRRLAAAGHEVTMITARYPGARERDVIDGIAIRRIGNRVSHYVHAMRLFARELRGVADLVVEEVNTVPYFLGFVPRAPRVVLFYHQLAREIWFYQMRLPLSLIGYGMEVVYTWLQGRRGNDVVTVSEDSKADLIRFGFDPQRIHVVTEGITNRPLDNVDPSRKERRFTVLFHSSLRAMKRPMDVVKAFEMHARGAPGSQLWMSGGGDQASLRNFCAAHGIADRVTFFGRTSNELKLDLMRRATVLCSTSVKEGWGLVVTEANSMGTPAIVYDIDGLRSASKAGGNQTVRPSAESLRVELDTVYRMFIQARAEYDAWCSRVLETTRKFSFERCYRDFVAVIDENGVRERRDVG